MDEEPRGDRTIYTKINALPKESWLAAVRGYQSRAVCPSVRLVRCARQNPLSFQEVTSPWEIQQFCNHFSYDVKNKWGGDCMKGNIFLNVWLHLVYII